MRRAVSACIAVLPLLLTLSPAWALDVDPQVVRKAGALYTKGERALQSGNVDKARDLFEKAVDTLPEFPQAHLGLGHIAMSENRFEDALNEYRRARDGYPNIGNALFEIQGKRYSDSQRQITEFQDSINQLRNAAAGPSAPRDAELRISQLENAISRLQSIQPPDRGRAGDVPAEVYFHIGNAQFRLGRATEALDSWTRCTETDPGFAMVHNNMAIALAQSGKLDEAREHLARAEELGFPVNPQFKEELAAAGGS